MFKTFLLTDINIENFEKLQGFLNENLNNDVILYLNSDGGNPDMVPSYKNLIELNKCSLIASEKICSAALDLFLLTNTPRKILDTTWGLFHQAIRKGMSTDYEGKVLIDKSYKKLISEYNPNFHLVEELLEISKKEMSNYKKGEDLYLNTERLKKSLKNSEKYFAER